MNDLISQLRDDLIRDEGFKLETYECTEGKLTVGIGRNLEGKGLSQNEIEHLIYNNIDRRKRLTSKYDIDSISNVKLAEIVIKDIVSYGITKEEAFYLFGNDVNEVLTTLCKNYPWVKDKSDNVKRVLANMMFNVGSNKFATFVKTLELIKNNKYLEASEEMLDSKWAKQVKSRAKRLSEIIKNEKV